MESKSREEEKEKKIEQSSEIQKRKSTWSSGRMHMCPGMAESHWRFACDSRAAFGPEYSVATHRSAAYPCHVDASRRDSPCIIHARGHAVAMLRPIASPMSRPYDTPRQQLGAAPKLFHEELLSFSRLEDGKKVHTRHLPHTENATTDDDATRDASGYRDALPVSSRQEKNSEVKRAQLGVVPGWVTFLGSLPTGIVVGPVCWLGRLKWYQSLAQPEVQELSATQGKVLRYGSHLLRPYFLGS
ncbi:hypothetical protein Taro_011002, partial [Colocasia esculenta]|nr:hypothetical protein [Colocasia esculenta]